MREILLINLTGEDRPGVTRSLTSILAQHNVTILDIGQAVIHNFLTLGLLIEVPAEEQSAPILKELLFRAHEMEMRIKFTPIATEDYSNWVTQQGKERHIITVLGRQLEAAHLADVTNILADNGLNIDMIHRLSGRVPLDSAEASPYACVEMSVRGNPKDSTAMRAAFLALSHDTGVDIAFQVDDLYRRHRRLIAFDMDSTLIQTEVIDELAAAAGVEDQVAAITERAMQGEMDFGESLRERLALLKGLDESVMADIAGRLPLTDGVERLFDTLHSLGFKIAILSGGFTYFGEYLGKKLGADYVYCNTLEIVDGKITGEVIGEVVDGERKASLLRDIARQENINMRQVVAVGDGANDLPMLALAGLGIAFRAKPLVKESARQALSTVGLDGILYFMGVRDRETAEQSQGRSA